MKHVSPILLFALMLLISLPVSAAGRHKKKDSGHIGIRVAYDLNRTTNYTDIVKWGSGGAIGMSYTFPFKQRWYFTPALLFNYDKTIFNGEINEPKYHYSRSIEGNMNNIGIRMPMDIGFCFINGPKWQISVFTGPQLFFNFKYKEVYDIIRNSGNEHIDRDLLNSGMEIGWNAGVALNIARHWHIQADYTVGLSKMGMNDHINVFHPMNFRRSQLSLGLGYDF
ncbi:MAG: PorT family protein [Muribaculaceae bacterium]|nr:PorT family protein [Muribaculaceae bacterium]